VAAIALAALGEEAQKEATLYVHGTLADREGSEQLTFLY